MSTMKRIWLILRSVAFSYLFMILMLMIFAMLLAYTSISESTIPTVVFVLTMISILGGSTIAIITFKENGLINGGLVGLIYVTLLYLFSSFFDVGFAINGYSFAMLIFAVLIGMIGGIIGVNLIKEGKGTYKNEYRGSKKR